LFFLFVYVVCSRTFGSKLLYNQNIDHPHTFTKTARPKPTRRTIRGCRTKRRYMSEFAVSTLGYLTVFCVAGISQRSIKSNFQLVLSRIWQRNNKRRPVPEQQESTAMVGKQRSAAVDGLQVSPSEVDDEDLQAIFDAQEQEQ
uniref:Uncharacterized protein n=1 Tax=Parascaris univalens TaxID=6257 RepID=A0A915AXE1_PARUN